MRQVRVYAAYSMIVACVPAAGLERYPRMHSHRRVSPHDVTLPQIHSAREVLVVDDIADECRTLEAVLQVVRSGEHRSLGVAVLVSKHGQRKINVPIDYVGFELKDG